MPTHISDQELKRRLALVSDEWEGIIPTFEAFYIHSIIYCADRSIEAFDRYDAALSKYDNSSMIVSSVHEALTHSSSLSRFFWPSGLGGKKFNEFHTLKKSRAAKLRKAFNLRDNSPLRDRKLRDALEHFDERLDQFLLNDPVGNFFPEALVDTHELADEPTGQIFKLVDPETSFFVLLNEKFSFASIRSEVSRIFEVAQIMEQNGCRLSI